MGDLGLFRRDLFGAIPFSRDEAPQLQTYLSVPALPAPLSSQLLSDAQAAALSNNVRRAVLELAIAVEVFVKRKFFKQGGVAGAAFEYLEDKGRETVKVIELLDGASLYAFGESFKIAAPEAYKHLDHLFRCRNKIAHRGVVLFRDDGAAWQEPTQELLLVWWKAVLEMFTWLEDKVHESEQRTGA